MCVVEYLRVHHEDGAYTPFSAADFKSIFKKTNKFASKGKKLGLAEASADILEDMGLLKKK